MQNFQDTSEKVALFTERQPSKHFNVLSTLFLGWCGVATSDKVRSTLCMPTLKFITLGNVDLTLFWTTLDNAETTLWIWTFIKKLRNKLRAKKHNKVFEFQTKKHLNWTRWTQNFLHFVPHFKFQEMHVEYFLQIRKNY